jgi:protein-disulfide isomerase
MLKLSTRTTLLTTLLAGAAIFSGHAQAADEFNKAQKDAIGGVIKEYLMENPEVIFDSIEAYRAKEKEIQQKKAQSAIKDNIAKLTNSNTPSIGAEDADVTVVEFFDYNCGYCKRAVPDIQAILEKDKKVRFVFQEMPILGPSSLTAAQWAKAAHNQGKYFDFHVALMEHRGPKDEDQLAKIAKKLELDVDQMKKDAKSDAIKEAIDGEVALARQIGINGTPAFIVGEDLYPGYIGKDGLNKAIEAVRKGE